jgi:hypothetical protein
MAGDGFPYRADIHSKAMRRESRPDQEGMNMSSSVNSVMKIPIALLILTLATAVFAQAPPELQAKLNVEIKQLVAFSADPKIVDAVKAYNATPPSPEAKAMTNENWHSLTIFDPFVRAIGKSPLSEFLKGMRNDVIIKVFVSGADGGKVGFDSKTEHWTHKGMPKHEVPMSGKTWIGSVKLDDSTGLQTIQVGLPVLSGGKPIGSIVFGLRADKLR